MIDEQNPNIPKKLSRIRANTGKLVARSGAFGYD